MFVHVPCFLCNMEMEAKYQHVTEDQNSICLDSQSTVV